MDPSDRVQQTIDDLKDDLVALAADLVRIPTVNPPGEHYADAARRVNDRLLGFGALVEHHEASGRPGHSATYPRINVVGSVPEDRPGPTVHFNGHVDVVPAGDGWTLPPFGGEVHDGRMYGRGTADMKGGLAAAVIAVEAIVRSGIERRGRLEVSATADEESGGIAGVAYLAQIGRIARGRTDHVIIPEPFGVNRICVGHRGVYWFTVTTHGRIAHGSMPFLGKNAIDRMSEVIDAMRERLGPTLFARVTDMPVVPEGARHATINVNAVRGGQAGAGVGMQTPCVPDRCEATFDRRVLPEESLDEVKQEIAALLAEVAGGEQWWEVRDELIVHPTRTPAHDPLVAACERAVARVCGERPALVASPGTYDHKHVTQIGGVRSCIAYGPGDLEQAHQPDESCCVDAMVMSARVMAETVLETWATR